MIKAERNLWGILIGSQRIILKTAKQDSEATGSGPTGHGDAFGTIASQRPHFMRFRPEDSCKPLLCGECGAEPGSRARGPQVMPGGWRPEGTVPATAPCR